MTLGEKQELFSELIAKLITWIYGRGWRIRLGEGYVASGTGHMKGSLHYVKLAMDLNLFTNGKFRINQCQEWDEIGAYWKGLHSLCRWGGDFHIKDYNHVSIEHEGRQ